MENMRVFRDGNQIVIVLENASEALEQCVISMVNGVVPEATHLSTPRPMQQPKVNTNAMTEVRPAAKAKFIERQERASSDMRTVQVTGDKMHPMTQQAEKLKAGASVSESKPDLKKTAPDIEHMNIFELREFLSQHKDSPALPAALMRIARTQSLAYVLNVKGEQELRQIAWQLSK